MGDMIRHIAALSSMSKIEPFALQQYARRAIFYDPVLYLRSIGKVSFKDFVLYDDASMEDV